jgi:hypothetical protein
MGKSCVRFKKIDDVPLEVIGQAFKRVPTKKFIEYYESALQGTAGKHANKATTRKTAAKKRAPRKNPSAKHSATKTRATTRHTKKANR